MAEPSFHDPPLLDFLPDDTQNTFNTWGGWKELVYSGAKWETVFLCDRHRRGPGVELTGLTPDALPIGD